MLASVSLAGVVVTLGIVLATGISFAGRVPLAGGTALAAVAGALGLGSGVEGQQNCENNRDGKQPRHGIFLAAEQRMWVRASISVKMFD
jgi:hypothetical protein